MPTMPWNITPGGPWNFMGMTMVVCEIDASKLGGEDESAVTAGTITLPERFVPESILPFVGGTATIAKTNGKWVITPTVTATEGIVKIRVLGHY